MHHLNGLRHFLKEGVSNFAELPHFTHSELQNMGKALVSNSAYQAWYQWRYLITELM
ncbi:hypothetical protein BVRB_3g064010 [Beta vulgaris subsp. vulgaris]|nr:hypothetical protein BVRB_3g064010 [Beta vulgaris subsp. vulgaris]